VLIGIDASRATGKCLTGTELYSREIIHALLQAAPHHRFRLYVRTPQASDFLRFISSESDADVEVIPIHQPRLWTHIGLAGELKARPPDVLFIPAHVLPFSRPKGLRTVVAIHDVGYRYFPSTHPFTQRLYLDLSTAFSAHFATQLIAVSQATQQDLMKFYHVPTSKIVVAHEGLVPLLKVTEQDIISTQSRFNLQPNQPYFLHIGTLQPRKNLRRLLLAFATLRDSIQSPISNLQSPLLVLAGNKGWGAEDLPALARYLNIADFVRFPGYITEAEKSALLRGAHAYVFPSLYEGFGLPVLEAQSIGTPVLCSNTSALPEVAGDGALLFDPSHERSIAAALQRILLDRDLRASLIPRGHANVQRFSWQAGARAILEVLEGRE
jgi:glycosyltransferase involved in cell wall biosynthesis